MHSFFISAQAYKKRGGDKRRWGPRGSGEPGLPVSGRRLPSISLLISSTVTSCGEPLPYSYIILKPGLEAYFLFIYLFLWWAAAVSGWFFGQLQGWLPDTVVNHTRGCANWFFFLEPSQGQVASKLSRLLCVSGCYFFLFSFFFLFCFLSPI